MKATIHTEYGNPRVLRVAEVARPELADDQILVEVHASPVTQGDRRLRAADFPGAMPSGDDSPIGFQTSDEPGGGD